MQIKTVHYSALINLGDYSNEKIGFTADIAEGETVEQVIEALRQKVKENGGENAEKLYRNLYDGKRELREIESKINKARAEWDAVAEFLKTQGIKPDAAVMPKFTNLLPEVKAESTVVDGELEEGMF
mgnify:CR=1 FL=1